MIRYYCERCREPLESRLVHLQNTTASRFFCTRCGAAYEREQLCDVCKMGRGASRLAMTVYRSNILGELTIRHCQECKPRSKISLEFEASPGGALAKYALIYGIPALCIILMIAALLSGAHH